MAEVTAAMVKALREATGLGMMECKKALVDADGDMEAAGDILRKKGVALSEKRIARETTEGLIVIQTSDDGAAAAMVEVQCETDFCARNDVFREMVQLLAAIALGGEDGQVQATDQMQEALQGALAKIGENISYARGVRLSGACVGTYVHHNGKVGVVVALDAEAPAETLSGLCMHIAFADPVGITVDDVPADVVEKEKELATQQAIESGKPPEIAEKIVAGKLRKFLAGKALLEQPFVRDDKKKVKEILGGATVTAFTRFAVGG